MSSYLFVAKIYYSRRPRRDIYGVRSGIAYYVCTAGAAAPGFSERVGQQLQARSKKKSKYAYLLVGFNV